MQQAEVWLVILRNHRHFLQSLFSLGFFFLSRDSDGRGGKRWTTLGGGQLHAACGNGLRSGAQPLTLLLLLLLSPLRFDSLSADQLSFVHPLAVRRSAFPGNHHRFHEPAHVPLQAQIYPSDSPLLPSRQPPFSPKISSSFFGSYNNDDEDDIKICRRSLQSSSSNLTVRFIAAQLYGKLYVCYFPVTTYLT